MTKTVSEIKQEAEISSYQMQTKVFFPHSYVNVAYVVNIG